MSIQATIPRATLLTPPKEPGISTDQYDLVWDAWNRLLEFKDGAGAIHPRATDVTFPRRALRGWLIAAGVCVLECVVSTIAVSLPDLPRKQKSHP